MDVELQAYFGAGHGAPAETPLPLTPESGSMEAAATETAATGAVEPAFGEMPASVTGVDAGAENRPQVQARLLEYGPERYIALPPHTTYALVEATDVVRVPGAARHACGLLAWRDMRLPMIDLDALLHPGAIAAPAAARRYALVVAYQPAPRAPLAFGAIALDALPQNITVGDEAQCGLPDDSRLWPLLALSCFRHNGVAVPILDTARLFCLSPDSGQASAAC